MNTTYSESDPVDENSAPAPRNNPGVAAKLGQSPLTRSPLRSRENRQSLSPASLKPALKAPLVSATPPKLPTPSKFEDIRQLDEEENWTERTSIVTKLDHQTYCDTARDIVENIVDTLPVASPAKVESRQEPIREVPVKETAEKPVKEPVKDPFKEPLPKPLQSEYKLPRESFPLSNETLPEISELAPRLNPVYTPCLTDTEPPTPLFDFPQTPAETQATAQQKPGAEAPVKSSGQIQDSKTMADPEDEIPVPKGAYNIDWDNFDPGMDPFQTKTKVDDGENGNAGGDSNPFQSKNKMAATPPPSPTPKGDVNENALDNFDPFTTKGKMAETPPGSPMAVDDPFATKSKVADEPERMEVDMDVSPFKSNNKMASSPPKSPMVASDPVTIPKATNSPKIDLDADPFVTKNKMMDTPPASPKIDMDANPFETKNMMVNTPPASPKIDMDADPFKTKNKMDSSPAKIDLDANPFETKTQMANSPPKIDLDANPFETKTQMANSPPKIDLDANPFETKTQMANSPPKIDLDADPFATKNKMSSSPPKIDMDANPFETKGKMASSPPSSPKIDLSANPFETKNKMSNSPSQSPKIDLDANPFETKTQMANSPPKFDMDANPFETKTEMANTPPSSPKFDSDANPFETKTKMSSSPPKLDLDADPFATKNKMSSSPPKASDINQNVADEKSAPSEDEPREGGPEDLGIPTSPSKMKSPKKKAAAGTKKGHIRFKMPKPSESQDEIQIFDGPKKPTETTAVTSDGEEFSDALERPNDSSNIQGLDIPEDEFKDASEAKNEQDEVFSDPADWDMLEKFGNKNNFAESALARQSLYVKFDPLVKAKSPEEPAAPPEKLLDGIESEDNLLLMGTPPPKEKGSRHPAARLLQKNITKQATEEVTAETSPTSQNKSDVDKFFTCSPTAMGENESGRLSTSPTRPADNQRDSSNLNIVHVLKYSQHEYEKMEKELSLDFQARLMNKERNWQLEKEKLAEKVKRSEEKSEQMSTLVTSYEETMAQLIADKETAASQSKDTMSDVVVERDQALEDLNSVEKAFSDLHRRYEALKQSTEAFKKNEAILKGNLVTAKEQIKRSDEKYEVLKQHAEDKLEAANLEIVKVTRDNQMEMTTTKAALKRCEMQKQSLEQQIQQKEKENQELTAICDELINAKQSDH